MSRNIEELGNGLVIYQDSSLYRFTTDAILLANIVSGIEGKYVADLGCGSGIISILLTGKKKAGKVLAVELQPIMADMARDSVALNNLSNVIEVVNGDMQVVAEQYRNMLQCVVCNPPYRRLGSGDKQLSDNLAISRHEVAVTLDGVIRSASIMLNNRGSMYMVHQSSRLAEIIYTCNKCNIEPKDIWPIAPNANSNPNLVIVKGVKCANKDCVVHKPIIIYDDNGNYTDEVRAMYEGE